MRESSIKAQPLPLDVTITPEPTPEERAAILIALQQILAQPVREDAPRRSAWAAAGRREAVRGLAGGARAGWGRSNERVPPW